MNKTTSTRRYSTGHKVASVFMSAAMLASSFLGIGSALTVASVTEVQAAGSYGLADTIQEGNTLHCFDWKISDILAELPAIAEAGFTSIQTSPIQPHDGQGAWYWLYQPLSFTAGNSEVGSEDELRTLCSEADKYGIKIIVDVVANHLAGNHSNIQDDLKDSQYWHNSGINSDNCNWSDRYQVTVCDIGMPDLNSEHSHVQEVVAAYANKLKSLGVDGIRWDAAKHIALPSEGSQFWPSVTTAVGLYNYGEILVGPDDRSEGNEGLMKEYTNYMSVTDSRYGDDTLGKIRGGSVPSGYGNWTARGLTSDKVVYWGESHDTYANGAGKGSNGASQNEVDRAYAIVASRYGSMGLYLSRPFAQDKPDIHGGVKGSTAFKSKEVAAVNHFKNAMAGKKDYYTSQGDVAVITRQGGGAVIVKAKGSGQVSVPNGGKYALPGTYTDEVSGNTFTVTESTISGSIGDSGIAVIYDSKMAKGARVSATPGDTGFTDTLSVTLNVSGASTGNYTTSEGASGSYTNGQTITIGASTAIGSYVTLTLSAVGEDGNTATATYSYLKKDPNAVTKIYFDNSSYNWSSVYAYIYDDSSSGGTTGGGGESGGGGGTSSSDMLFTDTLGWGTVYAYFFNGSGDVGAKWPGTQMTSNGTNSYGQNQFKIAVPSGATHVIFNNNAGTQTGNLPVSGVTGYYLDGSADNAKPYPTASAVSVQKASASAATATENAAWPGVAMTLNSSLNLYEMTVPDALVNGKVIFSDNGSKTNRYPADMDPGLSINDTSMKFGANNSWTAYSDPTPPPVTDPLVSCDKASGTSFTTETFTINLSLSNAVKGTYSVDNGPVKEFTSATDVVIGEGKIGDSTVKVDTTAVGSDGTTKTYSFSFEKKYVKKTTSSSAGLSSYYATNAKGKGAAKTITVDGDISDWDSSMLIAQGTANDDPRVYRPDSMYEVPKDLYALYAAYDDTNLYLMWEMTNVQDCVSSDDYPLTQGTMYLNENIPFFIALETGDSATAIGNNGKTSAGGTLWNSGITFENSFNKIIAVSTNGANGPYVYGGTSAGLNAVEEYNAKTSGIVFKYGMGIVSTNVYGIAGGYGINNNRVPGDICTETADWVDFNTKGHKSATMDYHYEMSIPLATLGITKSDVTSKGVGALVIMTSGKSGMDCLPYDISMNDNADKDDSAGSQENNSFEKSDEDHITCTFARIGAGEGPVPPTPVTLPLQVNFGADRSAPQATGTALTLKGIGYGGTAPYTYAFYVDGTSVKAASSTDSCTWTPSAGGSHTIKCVITDSTGKSETVSKTYTVEGEGPVPTTLVNNSTINKKTITKGQSVTLTGAASGGTAPYQYAYYYKVSTADSYKTIAAYSTNTTQVWTPSYSGTYTLKVTVKDSAGTAKGKTFTVTVNAPVDELVNKSTLSKTSVPKGTEVTIKGAATGGTSPYKYAFYVKKSTSTAYTAIGTEFGSATTATFTPSAEATYNIKVIVKDSAGKTKALVLNLESTKTVATLTATASLSKTTIEKGASVTIKASATGGTTPYKYAYYYKLSTKTEWTTLASYSTATSKSWTPEYTGTYNVKVVVKDNASKTATSKIVNLTVNKPTDPLTNTSTLSKTKITKGASVTIKGSATGGTTPYKYAYYYKLSTKTDWTTIADYSTATSKTLTPGYTGTYNVKVVVKDNAGKTAAKTINLTVEKPVEALTNTSSISSTSINKGASVTLKAAATGGTTPYKYAYYYKLSTKTEWTKLADFSTTASKTWTPAYTGTYDVKITVKDSASKTADKTFIVKVTAALQNTSTVKNNVTSVAKGTEVTLLGTATGGTTPYKFAYYYKKSTSTSWTTIKDFSTSTYAKFTPGVAATYEAKVTVKDNTGKTVDKTFTIKSTDSSTLANNATVSATSVTVGKDVTLKGAATGGTSPYQYAYYYKKSTASSWTTLKDFSTSTYAKFTTGAVATYDAKVIVKDSKGATATKTFTVKSVKDTSADTSTLKNTSTVKNNVTSVTKGTEVTLLGTATGGTTPYKFAYYYKKTSSSSWNTIKDFSTSTYAKFTPSMAASYDAKVVVKDNTGKTVEKTFTVTAK